MEKFRIIQPSAALTPFVKHYWVLETNGPMPVPQRIIPNGCIELVFYRKGMVSSLTGSKQFPRSFVGGQFIGYHDLTAAGTVNMLFVVFEPHGAKPFFRLPMNELNGRNIPVQDLGDKQLDELTRKVMNTPDDNACIRHIENFLLQRLSGFSEYNHKRMLGAINAINRQPLSTAELPGIACLSYKQFKRIFAEYIGANPKEFLRIVRFQRALYKLQTHNEANLAQLAAECGFYDQPHMINEFKLFSGYTPSEYIAVCPPYSDYFSAT